MEISSNTPAVVTGGASGLGAATARALAAKGAKVAIFDMNQEKGEALAAELGGVFCKVNVTSDEEVDAGFAQARAAHGQERVLVNCAGIGNAIKTASRSKEDGSIKHFPLSAFEFVIQVNLIGTFRCIAKSAAGMMTLDPLSEDEQQNDIGGEVEEVAVQELVGNRLHRTDADGCPLRRFGAFRDQLGDEPEHEHETLVVHRRVRSQLVGEIHRQQADQSDCVNRPDSLSFVCIHIEPHLEPG